MEPEIPDTGTSQIYGAPVNSTAPLIKVEKEIEICDSAVNSIAPFIKVEKEHYSTSEEHSQTQISTVWIKVEPVDDEHENTEQLASGDATVNSTAPLIKIEKELDAKTDEICDSADNSTNLHIKVEEEHETKSEEHSQTQMSSVWIKVEPVDDERETTEQLARGVHTHPSSHIKMEPEHDIEFVNHDVGSEWPTSSSPGLEDHLTFPQCGKSSFGQTNSNTKTKASKKRLSGGSYCGVAMCRNSWNKAKRKGEHLRFFSFPHQTAIRKVWIENCYRQDKFNVDNAKICEIHFKPEDFEDRLKAKLLQVKPRILKKDAIPSLNLLPTSNTPISRTTGKYREYMDRKQKENEIEEQGSK